MEASKRTLTDFISNNASYEIPFFQRSYVWEEEQWQRLVDDVIFASSTKKPLFLGAVIFKQEKEGDIVKTNVVIDGQQRLTTLFIFFKVLSLLNGQYMWFNGTFLNHKGKPILTQSHSCIDDFNYIMLLTEATEIQDSDANSQIKKAYKFFYNKLREIILVDKNKDAGGNQIIAYDDLYRLMNFVVISLNSNEDEQQIFDTINSLGVKLTTGELLKNYLFADANIRDYKKIWEPIFEGSSEIIDFWNSQITTGRLNKKTIDVFLYYYLQIKSQEKGIKGDKKLFRRWENLFSSFKTIVEDSHIDKDILALEIAMYAQIFIECFRKNEDLDDVPSSFGIGRISFIINNLDLTTLIPYVLYIINNVNDENERNKIFGYLETYIIRRIITDADNKNYSDLFSENLIGQDVKTYDSLVKYISSKNETTSLAMPSDDAVVLGFKQTQFKNNKRALAILYLLESTARSIVYSSTKLYPFDAYSLEHLMPKKWKKHWTDPSTCSEAERDTNILTLGNLAIIRNGLNNSIRNYDWQTKIAGKNDRPGLKEFSAGITTIDKYLSLEQWDESTIEQRANDLALLANKKWCIN